MKVIKKTLKKTGQNPAKKSGKNISAFYYLFALLAIALFFLPVVFNVFVNWDDPVYVTSNPLIQKINAENIRAIFSTTFDGHYHPLTLLALSIDQLISGGKPWIFHLSSLILHLLNCFLVYKIIRKLFENQTAALVAMLLFGLHPLMVEAVAWVSSLKDVLYALFFLLSLNHYINYIKLQKRKFLYYSICLFICSALAKEQAVALAPILILIDYYFSRKLLQKKIIFEKLPYFIIAIAIGLAAIYAQKETGYIRPLNGEIVSLSNRLVLGCLGLCSYLYKLILPVHLSAFYPYPFDALKPAPAVFWLSLLILPAFIFLLILAYKRSRKAAFGLWFFLISVFLMLRFLQANPGDIMIADRYMYIPSVGLFALAGWGFVKIASKSKTIKWLVLVLSLIIFAGLGTLSVLRIRVWSDSITLLNNILSQHPNVYTALNCRGDVFMEEGDYQSSLNDFSAAIKLNSSNDRAFANRGRVRALMGDFKGSAEDLNRAIQLGPKDAANYINRGFLFDITGDPASAITDYNYALRLNPKNTDALMNRGAAYVHLGDYNAALTDYNKALTIIPSFLKALAGRGVAYSAKGDFKNALMDFNRAIESGFDNPEVYYQRGLAYYRSGNFKSALDDFNFVIAAQPKDGISFAYRGFSYYNLERYPEAIQDLSKATELIPGYDLAYAMRGMAYIKSGATSTGCADLRMAANLGNDAAKTEWQKQCGN
jgi:tetratricopeptide (TPR) repeat protein